MAQRVESWGVATPARVACRSGASPPSDLQDADSARRVGLRKAAGSGIFGAEREGTDGCRRPRRVGES